MATDGNSEYVILMAFLRQQLLLEHASILRLPALFNPFLTNARDISFNAVVFIMWNW